ncbi:MAG: sigma-70 family RNA polymerase sigma factor [Archangium sp.]
MSVERRVAELLLGIPSIGLRARALSELLEARSVTSVAELDELNGGDLLLALATLEGDAGAMREFDRRLVAVCRGVKTRGLEPEELVQLVRERALVGPPPRLQTYSGRGALAQWLRAVALTTVSHATRSQRAHSADDDDEALAVAVTGPSPELSAIDRRRSRVILEALKAALARFDVDDRTLLRLRFSNGLTHDELAKVFGTHRTTAMRSVERCHKLLVERFHEALEAAEISKGELDSLSRLFEGSFVLHLQAALE